MKKHLIFAAILAGSTALFGTEVVLQNGLDNYSGAEDNVLWHVSCSDLTATCILNAKFGVPGVYEAEYNSQPDGQSLILYNLSC